MMTGVTRRALLARVAGLAAGLGVGVPLFSGLGGSESTGSLLPSQLPLPTLFARPLPIPAVLRPVRSTADADYYELIQAIGTAEILPGVPTVIWGYNGTFPGPTLVSSSGRTTVVNHRNTLPVPTVVHLHGGHTPADHDGYPTDIVHPAEMSPLANASMPGMPTAQHDTGARIAFGKRDYVYPMRQPAATLWYHDHRMDFTGPGVWRGLAGFHLVTDELERRLPLPTGRRDLPLMIADRSFAADGSLAYPSLDASLLNKPGVEAPYAAGVLGDVVTVNGVAWPHVDVPAVRHRLRLLNASNARRYRLALDPPPPGGGALAQIGTDGGLLERPLEHDFIDMAPGQRFDVIVDFARYPSGSTVTLTNGFDSGRAGQVLQFRVGDRTPDDTAIPDILRPADPAEKDIPVTTRTFEFRHGDVSGMSGWLINGRPFDPNRADAQPRLGTTEIWRLVTDFHHPIHLHLGHFRVLSRGIGGPGPFDAGPKDTLDLRPAEEAQIAVRFTDYPGRFVFHCHNLEHEDMAMMGTMVTRSE